MQLNGSRKVIGVLRGYDVRVHVQTLLPIHVRAWLHVIVEEGRFTPYLYQCGPRDGNGTGLIQWDFIGLPEHRPRRSRRRESRRGESPDWDGGA